MDSSKARAVLAAVLVLSWDAGGRAASALDGATISVVDGSEHDVGRLATSIALGADGMPVIGYYDYTAGALKVAKCTRADCASGNAITTLDDPANDVGLANSIAVGADGLPVIAYYDASDGALKLAKCAQAACSSAMVVTLDDAGADVGRHVSIAIGAEGRAVVAYVDASTNRVKVARCSNAACTGTPSTVTVVGPADDGLDYTSVAIGADGMPVIAFHDATAGTLRVAKCSNPDCSGTASVSTIDGSINAVGEYASIAIGADGLPAISYMDTTGATLKFAKCMDPACSAPAAIVVLDATAEVGYFGAIALHPGDKPAISYFDASVGALKLARCSSPTCAGAIERTTVDHPANDVGWYTDIAIGADNLPVISYYDATAGVLKVAKCGATSCAAGTQPDGIFAGGFE